MFTNQFLNKVIQGDCLEVMQYLPDNSVDMVLCDLPYGTTQNKWDSVIDLDKLWKAYHRVVKKNGAIVLIGYGIFAAKLIMSNEKYFKYKVAWVKLEGIDITKSRKQPLRKNEDICVFYRKQPTYNPQMTQGEAYDKGIRKAQQTGSYGDFKAQRVKSDGKRYPVDVVLYEENMGAAFCETNQSPTHYLPINLGRYLIRTYTNPDDVVLDNACGSGRFLLAALLEGRNFIGIEKNENVLPKRIKEIEYQPLSSILETN